MRGLEELISQNQNDDSLKHMYLTHSRAGRYFKPDANTDELRKIYQYCEGIRTPQEGVLWRWFNAYGFSGEFNYHHATDFLEARDLSNNLTANFLLYVVFFCRYLSEGSHEHIRKSRIYLENCRNLAIFHRNRTECFFYISDTDNQHLLPLVKERADGFFCPCTVMQEITDEHVGLMSMDSADIAGRINTGVARYFGDFDVFFVPFRNSAAVSWGQGFGQRVKAKIGFSYTGLRGFDLQKLETDDDNRQDS